MTTIWKKHKNGSYETTYNSCNMILHWNYNDSYRLNVYTRGLQDREHVAVSFQANDQFKAKRIAVYLVDLYQEEQRKKQEIGKTNLENTKGKTLREIAADVEKEGVRCNCDLDNWQPENTTGHSWVCNIHRIAMERNRNYND